MECKYKEFNFNEQDRREKLKHQCFKVGAAVHFALDKSLSSTY
jgi:hypothetical protein